MASRPDSGQHSDGRNDHSDDQQGTSRSLLPTPVAAALGVVVSGVRNARQLPTIASQLPIIGLGYAAQKAQTVRREYLDYAARGIAFVQKMTGEAVEVGGFAAGLLKDRTPAASNGMGEKVREAERSVEDEAREVAEKARDAVEKATQIRRSTSRPAGRKDAAGKPAGKRATPKPKPAAAQPEAPAAGQPEAPELPAEAIEAGAPGAATAVAEEAGQQAGAGVPSTAAEGSALSTDDLAIPDIDHLTLASLRARLRQLDVPQLVTLRAYELAHANRLQVVTMLENRIAKLEAEAQHPAGPDSNASGSAASSGPSSGEQAAQQAAEPGMKRAEAGADDLGATPRP